MDQPLRRSVSLPIHSAVGSHDDVSSMGESYIPRLPPDFSRFQMQKIRTNGCVKILNSSARWNHRKPWTMDNSNWTGSGFIITDRIIVTNAHVAQHGKVLTLRKQADGKRYPAKLLATAEQVDLAFLTVEDEEFWANALELTVTDELVRFQDEVHVVGYPTGGDTVCITEGVVSRIDWQSYSYSWVHNLCIQVDAAINAGNSGGPCLFDGKVCGVAFQGRDDADNVGYIIPSSILLRMIHEFKTRANGGVALRKFGEFPVEVQNLENPNMRKFANLPAGVTGVMVNSVKKFGWLREVLQVGDILISVDGNSIGLDGKVEFAAMEGGRIDFRLLISSKLVDEQVEISFVRKGVITSATVVIGDLVTMIPISPLYGTYYMFAGLVMIPSSVDLLYANWKKLDLTGVFENNFCIMYSF